MVRVCFVCLGNICRSPTAEAVMRQVVDRAVQGKNGHRVRQLNVRVDSAGTAAHHVGESPDPRSRVAAQRRGVRVSGSARQWQVSDWEKFDCVLAVDCSTQQLLRMSAPSAALHKLALLRSFDPASEEGAEVPDPYYGGEGGFEHVLDLCGAACEGLLESLLEAALREPRRVD